MKHTKGEWKVDIECNGNLHIVSNIEIIASINCSSFDGKTYEPTNEEMANAKIIAAAPKLLESLMRFIKFVDDHKLEYGYESAMIRQAKEAVKKATE